MIDIHYHKTKFTVPENFTEVSGKQFIQIAGILYTGGDALLCQVKAFRILARINRIRFRLMDPELVRPFLETTNWVFDSSSRKDLVMQLVPAYKGYQGPISDFNNLKMGEFHFSELYYKQLVYDSDEESLDSLVAVLYRKKKTGYDKKKDSDGDVRVPFNSNEIPYYASKINRWPAAVKQAIFLWYDSCRQKLIQDNPLVFAEPSRGFESQFDTGLYGVMRSLAGEKLGSLAAIEQMYVHTAMLELGLVREEEIKLEQEMKNNS